MIAWVAVAMAVEPAEPFGRAELLVDDERFDDVEALVVHALLVDGLPWVQIENVGADPITLDWSQSLLTPPNAQPSAVLPLTRREHDPALPVGPIAPTVLMAGDRQAWAVFPVDWAVDDIPNDEQLSTWTLTSFSGLELAVERGGRSGRYTALWRTQVSPQQPRVLVPVPRPVSRPPVLPTLTAAELSAREDWDAAYRNYRRQAKTSRSVWITSAVVGGLSALGTLASIQSFADAPADGRPDPEGRNRDDYRTDILIYSGLTVASIGVTVPLLVVEQRAKRRLRGLGRRP